MYEIEVNRLIILLFRRKKQKNFKEMSAELEKKVS